MAEPKEATGIQAFPYPDNDDPSNSPADVPLFIRRLAEAVEKRVFMVFDNASVRDTKLAGKLAEGMISYLKDADTVSVYTGTEWKRLFPYAGPQIIASNAVPVNSQGNNGDLWVQY